MTIVTRNKPRKRVYSHLDLARSLRGGKIGKFRLPSFRKQPLTDATIYQAVFDYLVFMKDDFQRMNSSHGLMKNWNTRRVTNMSNLFQFEYYAEDALRNKMDIDLIQKLKKALLTFNEDISRWNTKRVISMKSMFEGCIAFNQPIGKWNVSSLVSASRMFAFCASFNQPLQTWESSRSYRHFGLGSTTKNIVSSDEMFYYAVSFNQDLTNWRLFENNNIEYKNMFTGAIQFHHLQTLSLLYEDKLKTYTCYNDFKEFFPKAVLANMNETDNTELAKTLILCMTQRYMVYTILYQICCIMWLFLKDEWKEMLTIEIRKQRTSDAKLIQNFLTNIFEPLSSLKLTNVSLRHYLSICSLPPTDTTLSIQHFLGPILNWNTSEVTDFSYLFEGLSWNQEAYGWGISSWNVSKVKTIEGMFKDFKHMQFNLDTWNVSSVKNMKSAFENCANSKTFGISKWNVSAVQTMESMFSGCLEWNEPIDQWDVRSVETMENMFKNCKFVDGTLYDWKLNSLRNITSMFEGSGFSIPPFREKQLRSTSLRQIYKHYWDTRHGKYGLPYASEESTQNILHTTTRTSKNKEDPIIQDILVRSPTIPNVSEKTRPSSSLNSRSSWNTYRDEHENENVLPEFLIGDTVGKGWNEEHNALQDDHNDMLRRSRPRSSFDSLLRRKNLHQQTSFQEEDESERF